MKKPKPKSLLSKKIPFYYRGNNLFCDDIALLKLAQEVGTPTYIYSKNFLLNNVKRLKSSLNDHPRFKIYYSVKACSNIHILKLFSKAGCGADIVSGGELFRSSTAEIPPQQIIFSGVGKTEKELLFALNAKIHLFNVESLEELLQLNGLAQAANKKPKVCLRINPEMSVQTHPHLLTGTRNTKFGIDKSQLKRVFKLLPKLKSLNVCGFSCHIGSQITSLAPFKKAWIYLLNIAEACPFYVRYLNIGGGLGISNQPNNNNRFSLEEFGRLAYSIFYNTPYEIGLEPGRSLVGPAGILLTKVIRTKHSGNRVFAILDAGMNDFIRPALYGSTHPLLHVKKAQRPKLVDLVGPVCESADTFQTHAKVCLSQTNTLLAITNAGAYGMSMSSQYNSRPRSAEVLVDGNTYRVIRTRETYADLIKNEQK